MSAIMDPNPLSFPKNRDYVPKDIQPIIIWSFWFARRTNLGRLNDTLSRVRMRQLCHPRSSQFYNTQGTWQPLWWQCNVWCFTVAEAVCSVPGNLHHAISYFKLFTQWARHPFQLDASACWTKIRLLATEFDYQCFTSDQKSRFPNKLTQIKWIIDFLYGSLQL